MRLRWVIRTAALVVLWMVWAGLGGSSATAQEQPQQGSPVGYDWATPLPDPNGVGVEVGTEVLEPGGDGGDGDNTLEPGECRYDLVKSPEIIAKFQAEHPGEDGAAYVFTCYLDNFARNFGISWFPALSPEELARQAAQEMQLPAPEIRTNPPADRPQLVNVPTWLWVEPDSWVPVEATASVPGVTATVVATPQQVTWTMGDGAQVVCDGPGQPYVPGQTPADQQPACGHTYRQSSAPQPGGSFPVVATVTYDVTWEAVGAPGGGALSPVTSTAELTLTVAEVQALN